MKKLVYQPHTILAESIEYIWYRESEEACQELTIPALEHEIVFNLGEDFILKNSSNQVFRYTNWGSINGINTCPIVKSWTHCHKSMGIKFKPWGLYQTFGWNAMQFYSRINPLVAYFHKKTLLFTHELSASTLSVPARFALIEDFLLSVNQTKKVMEEFFHFLEDMQDVTSINKYLKSSKKSHNGFNSRFKKVMGIGPKQFLLISNVHKSMREIASSPHTLLTEVAYNNGYFDQSHFIKVFSKYTGMTPSHYKKRINSNPLKW